MSYFCKTNVVLIVSALLCACASPTVVQSIQPSDSGLSCSELQNQYVDAENFRKAAGDEKGMTAGNVARLLVWPAIIGTYLNANEAIAAADNRKVHLANLMNQKNCAIPEIQQATSGKKFSDTVHNNAATHQTKEERLADLKKLYNSNIISKEVYLERQKAILDAPE